MIGKSQGWQTQLNIYSSTFFVMKFITEHAKLLSVKKMSCLLQSDGLFGNVDTYNNHLFCLYKYYTY